MRKNGFTLIELLVVISIIAVLSTIGIVIFFKATEKARDNIRKEDLNKLSLALEIYAQKNGSYIVQDKYCSSSSTFYTAITSYMSDQVVPKDPKTGNNYCYMSATGATYTLCATLENNSDSEKTLNGCGDSKFNYQVTPK